MAHPDEREEEDFTIVSGICRTCREIVPARVFFRDGKVWQKSICQTCETQPALIAGDKGWYLDTVLRSYPDRSPLKGSAEPEHGCPLDCGPCRLHATPCHLPVFSITNVCNLECSHCFTYNLKKKVYNMSRDEMRRTLDWIVESSGPVDLINLTGGEPTLHPDLIGLLKLCDRPEIGRVTMNSNGIRLAQDPRLCEKLAELGVYVVLSFNTLDPTVSRRLYGEDLVDIKRKAIDNLTRAGARMTLLHVLIQNQTEPLLAHLFDLMRTNDLILSLTVQTMTYTGRGGGAWTDRAHIPVDEATRIVCEQSGGALQFSDFHPMPSAHALCYSICYMLKTGDTFLPFARFVDKKEIEQRLKDSYLIHMKDESEFFRHVIDDLYARGETDKLKLFRKLLDEVYPSVHSPDAFRSQRNAESQVRTVYIHAHMDEDNFDAGRVMRCPDMVPAEPGQWIPACAYNLFYRMRDKRFFVEDRAAQRDEKLPHRWD